jgi:DNA-binding IclR family transcriptional regulator
MRALVILEFVAQRSGGLTNAEICRKIKMATSTGSYILSRLEHAGYLARNDSNGRYEIGLKVIALAHGALRETGLRKAAAPALHQLARDTNYSALLAVLECNLVMIVDKVEGTDLAHIDIDIGVRYPAHTTALGKAMLAYRDRDEVSEMVDRFGLPAASRRSITTRSEFLAQLETVRKRGYAVSDGELFPGVSAVAAPIFDNFGNAYAAVSATSGRRPEDQELIVLHTMRVAKQISTRLSPWNLYSVGEVRRDPKRRLRTIP